MNDSFCSINLFGESILTLKKKISLEGSLLFHSRLMLVFTPLGSSLLMSALYRSSLILASLLCLFEKKKIIGKDVSTLNLKNLRTVKCQRIKLIPSILVILNNSS